MKPIADRESEVSLLEKAVESAASGHGSTVFISGEAGMGKSALCEHFSGIAKEKGFEVLKGWCFPEYLKPYLPMENALKPLGISHLFRTAVPPRVERIFLISRAGILLSSVGEENEAVDDDIFTGMLSAVGHFVRDSMEAMAGEGSLDVLGYGGMRIIMEKGELCTIAAVISGKENEYLINDLRYALDRVHEEYGELLDGDASMDEIEGSADILKEIMESGKYAGEELTDDPKLRMGSIMDNVSLAISRHAGSKPILLIIEDIQWADSASLSLFHYLSRNIRESKVLLIGTYRPEALSEGDAGKSIEMMLSEGLAEEIELGPVPEKELEYFILERIKDRDDAEEIAQRISSESGGNPLFAVEILNAILEGGPDARIPKRIKAMVSARIEQLSEDEREILEAASVLGNQFTAGILSMMLEKRKILILKSLRRMREKGIVEETAGTYRFGNPAVRELLYSDMGEELVRAYHEIAAESLESMGDADHASLGYHYYRAGIASKAVPELLSAAEEAIKNYSNREAVRLLQYAVEMTEGESALKAHKMLAEAHIGTGDYEKALDALANAEKLGAGAEIKRMKAECMNQMGNYEESLRTISEAMKTADETEKARLMLVEGNVLYRKGDYEGSRESLSSAMRILEFADESRALANALRAVGNIHFSRGEYPEALSCYEKAYKTDESDLSGRAMSLNNMGVVNVRTGDYRKAAEYFTEALKIREKIGDRWGVAMSLNNIGLIHLERGEYADAIARFEKAMNMRERIGDIDGMAASMNTMAMAYAETGDIGKAMELYERASSIKEELGDRDGLSEILAGMGRAYGYAGDFDKAEEILNRSISVCRETENRKMLAYGLCALAEARIGCGKDTDELMEELRPLAEDIGAREISAWYLRLKGIRARREEGMRYLKESLELFTEMGRKADMGKTLYWIGKLRGEKGEEEISAARSIFEECGMENWVKKSRLFGG